MAETTDNKTDVLTVQGLDALKGKGEVENGAPSVQEATVSAAPASATPEADPANLEAPPAPEPLPSKKASPWARKLGRTGRSIVGIEVGTRMLKLVHLHLSGSRTRVVDAAAHELPTLDDAERFTALSRLVNRFVSGATPRIAAASCALSGVGTATICCSMPRMDEKELVQALRWKLSESDSVDIEVSTCGYEAPDGQRTGGSTDYVAAAVPNTIGQMDVLFPGERPRLSAICTEPLAVENVFHHARLAPDAGPVAVLDIGARTASLCVIGPRGLEFTRTIPAGSDNITTALTGKVGLEQGSVEIDRPLAEQLKTKYTIGSNAPVELHDVHIPGSKILGLIRPALERLASEVTRSLQFYSQTHGLAKVDRLVLCGGGSMLGGLPEYFTKETRVATERFDPWETLSAEVNPDLAAPPSLFAVATGAALHSRSRLNLLPPHVKARKLFSSVRTISLLVSAVAVLALAGLSWTANKQRTDLVKVLLLKQKATTALEDAAAKIDAVQEHRQELRRLQGIHASLGGGNMIHAAILKELSNVMPEGTYLRSLSFSEEAGVRSSLLSVDIYATPALDAMQLKQQLMAALETSPFFVNVSFTPAPGSGDREAGDPDEALDMVCQVLGFQETDPMATMGHKTRMAVLVGVQAAVIGATALLAFQPSNAKTQDIRDQIDETSRRQVELCKLIEANPAPEEQVRVAQAEIEQMQGRIPPEPRISWISEQIAQAMQTHRIDLRSATHWSEGGEPPSAPALKRLQKSIVVRCSARDLQSFLETLNRLPFLVTVEDLSVARDEMWGAVSAEVHLATFVLRSGPRPSTTRPEGDTL